MKPETLKSLGYVLSIGSVVLLGWTAWPGAEEAGLTEALELGMAASVLGMGLRWYSYTVERRHKAASEEGVRPSSI